MNHTQAVTLREHARRLEPRMAEAVAHFYDALFERHPSVRGLFPADMTRQRGHLLATVALVAKNADRLDTLEEPLMDLGAHHASIGAMAEHYPLVLEGLLESLREADPAAWTREVEGAWRAALSRVAELMLMGAARAAQTAADRIAAGVKP